MAGLPVDVKELMKAFGDLEAARQQSVRVCILLDPQAPDELHDFVRDAFATVQPNALVSISVYEDEKARAPFGTDLVVLAAGFSPCTGALSARVRASGTPVLVVSSMPDIVSGLASASGHELLSADLLAPKTHALHAGQPESYNLEPLALDEARKNALSESMGAWVVDVFREKKLAFALCFPFVRKPLALDAVKATATQNAAVGAVAFIPGADMPVMTLNQAKMILQIAAAYGQKMGMERAKELAGVIGGAFALRTAARQVVGAVPGFGWAVKGAIGYSGTIAMGRAAIVYFESLVGEGASAADALAAARAEAEKLAGRLQGVLGAARGGKNA